MLFGEKENGGILMAALHWRAEHFVSLLKDLQSPRRQEDMEMDNVG